MTAGGLPRALSAVLRARRAELGWTQQEVATWLSVSRSAYADMEAGRMRRPRAGTAAEGALIAWLDTPTPARPTAAAVERSRAAHQHRSRAERAATRDRGAHTLHVERPPLGWALPAVPWRMPSRPLPGPVTAPRDDTTNDPPPAADEYRTAALALVRRLETARHALGLTATAVARALGVSQPAYAYWTRRRDPRLPSPQAQETIRLWLSQHEPQVSAGMNALGEPR